MADKSTQIILAALSRAAAAPDGLPLFAVRGGPGLFVSTAVGKQAAQRCKDEGWLRCIPCEPDVSTAFPDAIPSADTAVLVRRRKAPAEICLLTEKGLSWLLSQTSPRQVLEDFVRAVEARQLQAAEMLTALRRMQSGFDALKAGAETVLGQLSRPETGASAETPLQRFLRFHNEPANGVRKPEPLADVPALLLARLTDWQPSCAGEDCPLPELYRRAQGAIPGLTIGSFHDALRRLHDAGQVYLHPWTGPLHALPEPPLALLAGHEIAYYASIRQ